MTRARILGATAPAGAVVALLVAPLVALGVSPRAHAAPPAEGPAPTRAADDFRRSDPAEVELAPVAESSGLSDVSAAQPRQDIVELREVLDLLPNLDPRLEAADLKVVGADAKLLAARGGWDTKLGMAGLVQPAGEYRHGIFDVEVVQATPLYGLSVWTGWRVGLGEFAVYDGKLGTAAGGEVRAGATLPLWQGGVIDRTRADIRQARAGQRGALSEREAKLLELEAKAAKAYWTWVAAGLTLDIERELLELALARDVGLRRKIELGDVEAIVGVDNRRLILDREGRVVSAERSLQEASLALSLFMRDPAGEPLVLGADRLPTDFPRPRPPQIVDIEAEVDAALARRPDLAALERSREQADVELRYAKNQRSARVDVSGWVAQDLGAGATPLEVAALVEVEIPIPMRKTRGKFAAARAELGQVEAELRFARDQVAVEVRDAHSELAADFQRARLAGEQLELARSLADAELRRFELGAGDLLLVNLRELAFATAQREQVKALADFFEAQARLDVALGLPVSRDY